MNLRKFSAALLALSLTIAQSGILTSPATAEEPPKLKFNLDYAKPTITDAEVQSAIDAIDQLAQKQIDNSIVPGLAIAVVHNDKLVFAKGYGVREVGKADKIDPDTVFQLASISKSVGSTVVAAAVGEKIVSWDSKISDLDPSFALSDPWVTANLTIRDLYSHRSGLPAHAADILEDIGYDRAQILHRLRYQKPASSFRSKYAYTNYGLTEAGVATAKAARTSWEDLSKEKLYKPIGMNSTSSSFADFMNAPNKAMGHMRIDGKWVHKHQRTPDPQSPAGGVCSSVNDMSKWMRLQIENGKFEGKQIVDENAVEETHTPQMVSGRSPINGMPEFYGLGFNVSFDKRGRRVLSHSGGFQLGAATNVKMIPSEKLGICVLTNGFPIGVAEGMTATFTDLASYGKTTQNWMQLFKQIFEDPTEFGLSVGNLSNPPKSPTPAQKLDSYVGTYENDFYGDLKISASGDGLSMTLGNNLVKPIKHYDRDTFTWQMESEDLWGVSAITFAIGADGRPISVMIDNLNNNGQGLFTRAEK